MKTEHLFRDKGYKDLHPPELIEKTSCNLFPEPKLSTNLIYFSKKI